MTAISFERAETPGLVSIVIPAHQSERFIGETLETIATQSYRKWEVVVVEDGRRDGIGDKTEQVVRAFARKHRWHRVEYIRSPRNFGQAHTRNVAFPKCAGEFVAFLDSDDRWFADHLDVSVEALRKTDKDIVYSTALIVQDKTELILGIWGPNVYELAEFPQSLVARNMVPTSSSVMRRQALGEIGLWNVDCRYCDDFEFWLRCAMANKTFHYIGGCHCLYRKHHNGAVTQKWCGTWEESASLSEKFMDLPGTRKKTSRKYASNSFAQAAELHSSADPFLDPSVDPSRAADLWMKAWRLKPRRMRFLIKAVKHRLLNLLRRNKEQVETPTKATAAQPNRKAT